MYRYFKDKLYKSFWLYLRTSRSFIIPVFSQLVDVLSEEEQVTNQWQKLQFCKFLHSFEKNSTRIRVNNGTPYFEKHFWGNFSRETIFRLVLQLKDRSQKSEIYVEAKCGVEKKQRPSERRNFTRSTKIEFQIERRQRPNNIPK